MDPNIYELSTQQYPLRLAQRVDAFKAVLQVLLSE
jgi:hypothetical protein